MLDLVVLTLYLKVEPLAHSFFQFTPLYGRGLSDLLDKSESASVFYLAGGFIIIAACMGGASIYKFAMRREIAAFKAQQVIPVAKEGMEALAPAAGTAAKEIAKGVREGINGREE